LLGEAPVPCGWVGFVCDVFGWVGFCVWGGGEGGVNVCFWVFRWGVVWMLGQGQSLDREDSNANQTHKSHTKTITHSPQPTCHETPFATAPPSPTTHTDTHPTPPPKNTHHSTPLHHRQHPQHTQTQPLQNPAPPWYTPPPSQTKHTQTPRTIVPLHHRQRLLQPPLPRQAPDEDDHRLLVCLLLKPTAATTAATGLMTATALITATTTATGRTTATATAATCALADFQLIIESQGRLGTAPGGLLWVVCGG
jgi:hypothetical protein